MTVLTDAQKLVTLVVGAVLLAAGLVFIRIELRTPPIHTTHLYVFVGLSILGALMIAPDAILSAVKGAVSVGQQAWAAYKNPQPPVSGTKP